MTLDGIITSALAQLDRGSDEQLVTKYKDKFVQYANEAQQDLAKAFPLHRTETVNLVDGKFYTTDLSRWAVRILNVIQKGNTVFFDHGGETGEIVCNATGAVSVKYRYLPNPMSNSSDKPDLPAHLHPLIVTYVVASERASGDPTTQSGAAHYFQSYANQKRDLMQNGYGTPSSYKLKNY